MIQTLSEGLIEVGVKKIGYGPLRDWGTKKSRIIFGERQLKLNEVTDWKTIRESSGIAQKFEEGMENCAKRARELAPEKLQQAILNAEGGEEIEITLTQEDLNDNRVVNLLSQAFAVGFAVQEVEDEELVEVVTRVEEEEVIRVFTNKKGNKVRFSTPSK